MQEPHEFYEPIVGGSHTPQAAANSSVMIRRDEVQAYLEAGADLPYIEVFDTRDDQQLKRGIAELQGKRPTPGQHMTPETFRLYDAYKGRDIVTYGGTPSERAEFNTRLQPLLEAVQRERAKRQEILANELETARAAADRIDTRRRNS